MRLTPTNLALLAEWRAELEPLGPDEIRARVYGRGGALLVLQGSRGTVFASELDCGPTGCVLTVWAQTTRTWDDGTPMRISERHALLSAASRLLSADIQLVVHGDSLAPNTPKHILNRYVLEVILRKELLEHDYPPEGLRFVEAGDVVGESSYEGELNAVFRVSGFSLRANGMWTDHLWQDVERPLMPPEVDLSGGPVRYTLLQVELRDDQVVGFEVDHFWGYYSMFRSITRWHQTGSDADWWKRLEARKSRPRASAD